MDSGQVAFLVVANPQQESAKHAPVSLWGRVWIAVILVFSWLLVLARAIPERSGDRGVFVSMAERLAAGDVLYVDVWDNKEPLFFLTLAAGRLVSPYMDVVLELLWILAICLAAFALIRTRNFSPLMSTLVAFSGTPLIITGAIYYAGFTHLPSTALTLAGFALLVRGHPVLSGVLLAVLVGFKIIIVPVSLALFLAWFLVHRDRRGLILYVLGGLGGLIGLALLLIARGELTGFIDLLISNIGYSQSPISDAYAIPIWVHLEPVMQNSAVVVLAITVAIITLARLIAPTKSNELWWGTLFALLSSILVLGITGLWIHHGQILYIPATLALLLAVTTIPQAQIVRPASIMLVIALSIVLSGSSSMRATVDELLSARGQWTDLARLSEPSLALLEIAPDGASYARLGKNTDDSHAQGLRDFSHPCYQFVQYTYDLPSTLEFIPECLPSVDYVIVDPGLQPEVGQDRWNVFVAASEKALGNDFACEERDWGRLCTNKRLTGPESG